MTTAQLELKANEIRQDLIKMLEAAGSGHSAGPLDLADLFTALYFGDLLKYDAKNPTWEDRDRFVLSCGHTCPILYTTLIHAGFLRADELLTLRKFGSRLQGHPHHEEVYGDKPPVHENTPGVENSAGPLAQGISVAVGMALAAKMDKKSWRTYVVGSDGEMNEGQVWEALMCAAKYKLSNLTYFVDRNNIQIDGYTEHVMPLDNVADRLRAFNLNVLEVDGHSFEQIIAAVKASWEEKDRPTAIVCYTIPGKGVDYMEGDYIWHGAPPGAGNIAGEPPKDQQAELALKSLRTLAGRITHEG